jgi:DEAD/DEAH box helicase domain-containing protein
MAPWGADLLRHIRSRRFYRDQIVHVERLRPRRAWYSDLARPLPRQLSKAVQGVGVKRFYVHQAQAIDAIRAGKHVIVATSTASGKTLIYNVPVIERCLHDVRARALYLFPTKALAQDQLRALGELLSVDELAHIRVGVYDGDTPRSARSSLRRRAAIMLTNPDMLHLGILPNHHLWNTFFKNLRYVVIDEAHVYRGVFGSQVGCVLRRLRRICALYGSQPQFVACSATIANPDEHLETLTGLCPEVVDEDGSPQAERTFVLWNPPLVDKASGARRSANTEAAHLFVALVQSGVRNLTFARTRRGAELILRYAQEALTAGTPELVARVAAYRAGYLAEQRRALEQALFSGQLIGLATTSALELGIDVGHLDAAVLVGYPGTIASMWQQAGRAGRGEEEALNVLVGLNNPLDQYFMGHPEDLFRRTHEAARCDPSNAYVLMQHLACAAYESPLTPEDQALFSLPADRGMGERSYVDAMVALEESGQLEYRGHIEDRSPRADRDDRWFYVGRRYPAQGVGLRSAGSKQVVIVDTSHEDRVLEEIDAATAHTRAHPGAIYLHQGASYLISDLDLRNGVALAKEVEVGYYTQPRQVDDMQIIQSIRHRQLASCVAFYGRVRVTSQVIGYSRKKVFSDEVLSQEPLDLTPQVFETMGVWWDVPSALGNAVVRRGQDLLGGLHAVEHACIGMLPLLAMCDRLDLGGVSTARHADTEGALICVYDAYPGGVGLAERGFEVMEAWWQATLEAIRTCPCRAGCPSCIHSPKCGNNNEPLDKEAAVMLLSGLLNTAAAKSLDNQHLSP